jgi:5'-methylthioadenosine/S-adenosylhomocysteine nucleosidase
MQGEAQPLIDYFKLTPLHEVFPDWIPMRAFQNSYRGITISLVINGHDDRFDIDNIGTQPATLAAYLAIEHLQPDLVINAGVAGGFKEKDLEIGDVVLAQGYAWFHDRRIPIPKFQEYGLGEYPLTDQTEMIHKLGIKTGIISTGSSFDYTGQDEAIMQSYGATLKDMEAAAIAWVCEEANMPFLIIKGITDHVGIDHASEKQFLENFTLTIQHLKNACIRIVNFLVMPG